MKIRKIRIKNKGRVGGKNWTERVAEPEKTRIKLTNVLTIHCIVWSDVALIWRQMHLVWLCDVKNGKWKRIVYTVQKVKGSVKVTRQLIIFGLRQKCVNSLYDSALPCTWVIKRKKIHTGKGKVGKNTTSFVWQWREVSRNLTMNLRYYYKYQKIYDNDLNQSKKLLKPTHARLNIKRNQWK